MELREFAEQVLFATSLADKLRTPDALTDERPGLPLVTPDAPGRPPELRFKPQVTGKAEFPGTQRLDQSRERGRLLHFFANHELLATELMALVLLRFPDAPAAFRKGVAQTLRDEQKHTRLYLERMRACGIAFGELPVSGYFWRTVSTMESPLDYVASLCLTFEQANLDFARHFAQGFAKVGDTTTANLLEKIYRDEIGHVAYGLKWFRRWKNPDENDWQAFCRALKFPLSPQRAKGFTLNIEGRRAAGLDAQFIAELNVYSQSKGRTPSVFVFNPFAEGRIAFGKAFNPTKHQAQLARDLENLPQFLCRQDDIVLVEQRPAVEFLSAIKQAGFALPEFVEVCHLLTHPAVTFSPSGGKKTEEKALLTESSRLQFLSPRAPFVVGQASRLSSESHNCLAPLDRRDACPTTGFTKSAGVEDSLNLSQRKLGRLRPWAWGPDSVELLAPLFTSVTAESRTPSQRFNPRLAQLYSKAWSAEFLRTLLKNRTSTLLSADASISTGRRARSDAPYLCTEPEVGVVAHSMEEALAAIAAIRARGHHQIVAKEALGVAGSNALRLLEPKLLDTQRRWLENSLRGGRQLVVEPWLEREIDFSVQLEMTPDGLKLCGFTGLLNDARGQFCGNWAESHHHTRIPTQVVSLFREPANISRRLLDFYAEIFATLETELRAVDFIGPLGIDAFVYRTASGEHRLKPIVEINPRYTMGRVLIELMKQTCQGSCGVFRLLNRQSVRASGFENFPAYANALKERFPLCLASAPSPRIREGVVCLNDPARAQVCLAVFQVGRSLDALLESEAGNFAREKISCNLAPSPPQ